MAITFVAATSAFTVSTVSSGLACTKPAGVTTGDLMLALVGDESNTGNTITSPGWTQSGATFSFAGMASSFALFYKYDNGTAGPYTFTTTGSTGNAMEIMIGGWRGTATSPDVQHVDSILSVTADTNAGLTPSAAGETLVYMGAFTPNTYTAPGSYTTRLAVTANRSYIADRIGAPGGATGTVTATLNISSNAVSWLVALAPAPIVVRNPQMIL